ncbi:hypothetical protein DOTSEDRAFT_74201 [Dothistroma septosporum NZE10]|uniref:Uncharacterized protein n=1 Tax=Dothistroma septosporum (strain NZE10 / CBS 128990) TaxID=675120 RepID=N1PGX6_DOTSN|nr:hypothetical protein DOTSEDRAFT_74201 [Dothistroma septosporum NZE10]
MASDIEHAMPDHQGPLAPSLQTLMLSSGVIPLERTVMEAVHLPLPRGELPMIEPTPAERKTWLAEPKAWTARSMRGGEPLRGPVRLKAAAD